MKDDEAEETSLTFVGSVVTGTGTISAVTGMVVEAEAVLLDLML